MLMRPPRHEDDHEDSLVLLKNVGNSKFQGATLVNAIAANGLYPSALCEICRYYKYFFPCNKFVISLFSLSFACFHKEKFTHFYNHCLSLERFIYNVESLN